MWCRISISAFGVMLREESFETIHSDRDMAKAIGRAIETAQQDFLIKSVNASTVEYRLSLQRYTQ